MIANIWIVCTIMGTGDLDGDAGSDILYEMKRNSEQAAVFLEEANSCSLFFFSLETVFSLHGSSGHRFSSSVQLRMTFTGEEAFPT